MRSHNVPVPGRPWTSRGRPGHPARGTSPSLGGMGGTSTPEGAVGSMYAHVVMSRERDVLRARRTEGADRSLRSRCALGLTPRVQPLARV
jgi:hypothetical protein